MVLFRASRRLNSLECVAKGAMSHIVQQCSIRRHFGPVWPPFIVREKLFKDTRKLPRYMENT